MTQTVTDTPAPVDAAHVTPRTPAEALNVVSSPEYLRQVHAENKRLRDLADDRQRRINAAMFLVDQYDPMSRPVGFVAVLLADLRTVLTAHRDPRPVCIADSDRPNDAPVDRTHCYWCNNGVAPQETAGTHGLAAQFEPRVLDRKRAEMAAAGQDPSLAPVLLRRERAGRGRRD
jgi:hypothetical protein